MIDNQLGWNTFITYGYGNRRICNKNTYLFRQGEVGTGFYYLTEGEVKISLLTDQGIERDIDYVMPGELIGEQALQNEPYLTSAMTTTPSILYFFSNKFFNTLCFENPGVANILVNSLIQKVRLLAESTSFLNAPADYRLAHFLYKLYIKKNETTIFKINQTSLARFIGTSRITVYKIMKQWEKDEFIKLHKGYIYLLDLNRLERFLNPFYS